MRKWVSGHSRWHIQWVDDDTFKADFEGEHFTKKTVEEWGTWMDTQIGDRSGNPPPRLIASLLNFSRAGLGDTAVYSLVEYLRSREIGVHSLKLFRNSIGDEGAMAVGQLLAQSPIAVQEVHLSHNVLTERGALSLVESIARCGTYPCLSEGHQGKKDSHGRQPVWLRLEHNRINWEAINHRLENRRLHWCTGESRDGWYPRDRAPMFCLHNSYRNQNLEQTGDSGEEWGNGDWEDAHWPAAPDSVGGGGEAAIDGGQFLLAALKGDAAAKKGLNAQLGTGTSPQAPQAAPPPPVGPELSPPPAEARSGSDTSAAGAETLMEEVPFYVFLDAAAVGWMATRKDGAFTFQGLLNLCRQGHMKCMPPKPRPVQPWVQPVEERDCAMLVVTDAVLSELAEQAEKDPAVQQMLESLRDGPDAYLQQCHDWGIVEVLETALHTQLMRLTPRHERLAREMRIQTRAVQMLDFVALWESQIEVQGKVILVTGNEDLCHFVAEVDTAEPRCCPPLLHVADLNQRLAQDESHGGSLLSEAAKRSQTGQYCGAVLSAGLLSEVAGLSKAAAVGEAEAEEEAALLRKELLEASTVLTVACRLLRSRNGGGGKAPDPESERCLERVEVAQKRWRPLFGRVGDQRRLQMQ
mmetsp:Transcript_129666/g.276623  ORF Transcript_129666/g.276623 Transcript_129666/m.276623 type:complete len:637 (-) Transcript_129666:25-1935(-)